MHPARDHHLPPDPDAYRHAPHPNGRIIVIAPTRAACETIELALGLHLDTLLEREHGEEIRTLAASGKGFGIVAGTGTGKTLGIRPIAESILAEPLTVGVVNREREATPETPSWNVVIVTTGHRAALVPGRPDHRPRHGHRRRDPPDLRRARAVPGAGEAGRLPLHLAQRHGGPGLLRPLPRQRRGAGDQAFDPALKAKVQVLPQKPDEFLERALHPPSDQGEARRGGVRAHPRRGRAAGARSWASSGSGSPRRSITAASRSA